MLCSNRLWVPATTDLFIDFHAEPVVEVVLVVLVVLVLVGAVAVAEALVVTQQVSKIFPAGQILNSSHQNDNADGAPKRPGTSGNVSGRPGVTQSVPESPEAFLSVPKCDQFCIFSPR